MIDEWVLPAARKYEDHMTQSPRLRDAALRWAGLAAEKQFANRKGHGGNAMLAERHLTRQELQVLLAAPFEAGAALGKDLK